MDGNIAEYWKFTYVVCGDTLVAQVLDPETGEFRVTKHIARTSDHTKPGYCPESYLDHIRTRNGKEISNETMHIILYFDFDGIARIEMESFISALINYVTTMISTSIQTKDDFDDLVKGYSLK